MLAPCCLQDVGSLQDAVARLEELERRLAVAKRTIGAQDGLIKSLTAQNERNSHQLRELKEDSQEQLRVLPRLAQVLPEHNITKSFQSSL